MPATQEPPARRGRGRPPIGPLLEARIHPHHLDALRELAASNGRPIAAEVRQAVTAYLAAHGRAVA